MAVPKASAISVIDSEAGSSKLSTASTPHSNFISYALSSTLLARPCRGSVLSTEGA